MLKKFIEWLKSLTKKSNGTYLGEFTITYYWNAFEKADRKRTEKFSTQQGKEFRCSQEFLDELTMEGMGFIDGQWIGYWNKKFHEVPYPTDARGKELIADYSIATSKEIPMGTLVKFENSQTTFQSCDVGSAIKDYRIDIYIFSKDQLKTFQNKYGLSGSKVKVYKLK